MDVTWSSLQLDDPKKVADVEKYVGGFRLSDDTLKQVQEIFLNEMKLGLSKDESKRKQSSCVMESTYLRDTLHGKEEGDFLALDLGGTRFRILLVRLHNHQYSEIFKVADIPDAILVGSGDQLFAYIADRIFDFLEENNLHGQKFPLGFTFSFPMIQKSLKCGILITWTKSFKCSGCVGEDAVKHLENAIKIRGGMDIEVVAIVNDTTGTLMAGAYLDEKCRVGVILGTGFNACYVEKLENVEKWDGDYEEPRQVLIDTEMGAFGDNGVLDFFKTEYDFEVDQVSNHVHSFTFEKMFSGHYLGEVVRLTMLKLISEGLLFGGTSSNEINQRWGLKTEHVAFIDGEKTDENTRNLLKEMKLLEHGGKDDIAIIKHVCALVSERGGFLVGSCMAVLLNRMQEPDVTIAVDGSVYKHHARLHQLIMRKIEQFAPKYKCKIIRADDGSGKGAGLVAAVAVRLEKERQRHMAAVAAN